MKRSGIYIILIICIITLLMVFSGCNKAKEDYEIEGVDGLLGFVKTPGFSKDVFARGDYAFVVDDKWGTQVVDIVDKEKPSIIGNLRTNWAWDFYLYKDYGLVADYAEGFVISDLTNPAEPEIILKEDILVGASSLFVQDTTVYVTDHSGKLLIMDITEIREPVRIAIIEGLGWVYDVCTAGEYAFIIARSAGDEEEVLTIIDVNDPENPEILSTTLLNITPIEIVVQGDYAYIAGSRYGVITMDILDKRNPYEKYILQTEDEATDIIISGSFAYIADRRKGVIKAFIEDDGKLSPAKSWELPGYPDGVYVSSGYIFVANYDGLLIFADN